MPTAVKKTISLPADLECRHPVQGYWSREARERGVLTEKDLERYLRAW